MEIWHEPQENAFKFQFILKNKNMGRETDGESNRIAGHTFVVLRPEQGSRTSIRTYPWTALKDGKPSTYNRGQYFAIARFKYVRGTLRDISSMDRFKTATVYVYTVAGDLLEQQVFQVGDVLRAEKSS
jgi:hypothetical protein